jgi:uncharacterized membrane protein YdjX (TVP38/TMEM64 family)
VRRGQRDHSRHCCPEHVVVEDAVVPELCQLLNLPSDVDDCRGRCGSRHLHRSREGGGFCSRLRRVCCCQRCLLCFAPPPVGLRVTFLLEDFFAPKQLHLVVARDLCGRALLQGALADLLARDTIPRDPGGRHGKVAQSLWVAGGWSRQAVWVAWVAWVTLPGAPGLAPGFAKGLSYSRRSMRLLRPHRSPMLLPTRPHVHFHSRTPRAGPIVAYEGISAESVVAISEWASSQGAVGLAAFATVHAFAVVLCFPATILFELAAGFAFGAVQGAALAWAAKVSAALLTFVASSGVARAALARAGVEDAAARAFAAQPSLARIAKNVEADGARYTLLARLSPIPSWLNNYGLAFAGVRFADYAPATAVATLPAVLTHAYAGSLLSSLLALMESDGGAAMPSTLAGSALGALSAVGGGLLLRELAAATATSDEAASTPEQSPPKAADRPER